MREVQPLRDKDQIEMLKDYLKDWDERNFLLFIFGLNTGLRISDILPLKVRDVEGEHLYIKELKTDKTNKIYINATLRKELNKYIKNKKLKPYSLLFESKKRSQVKGKEGQSRPISKVQAWRIINKAAKAFGISNIGTHTMRKTFGYHMYQKNGHNVAMLMEMFNHSSPDITLRYIGINQEAKDNEMTNFSL